MKNEQVCNIQYGGQKMRDEIERTFSIFLSEAQQKDSAYKKKLQDDVVYCWLRYKCKPEEYFLYHFEGKSHEYRSSYCLDAVKDSICIKQIGANRLDELKDKFGFYQKMQAYYFRDVCKVEGESDRATFHAFTQKHSRFIVKPNKGTKGQDTRIIDIDSDYDNNVDKAFKSLVCIDGGYIVEELISQASEMAKWNLSSVNTVRLPAVLNSKGWFPIAPFLRVGRSGMVVDNAGAGGLIVPLDSKTGAIINDAADENGKSYSEHPDSHIKFKGQQIPAWVDLLKFAETIHRTMPEHKYVGWDFALTDKGWVLVEGNWGQLIWQIPMQQGIRKEFEEYMYS